MRKKGRCAAPAEGRQNDCSLGGGKAVLILVPLADWNYEKQISAVGKVRDVRHPVRPVMTQYSQLLLIPMWAYDHDVRTNMKLAAR